MSRYNFDRLKINSDKLKNESPSYGKSFLETLLNQSTETNSEENHLNYLDELDQIIAIPNRLDRSKKLKFLRFPKLKEMLDALADDDVDEQSGKQQDILTRDEAFNQNKKENHICNDTEEFLNSISDKLKHFAVKAKKIESPDNKNILLEDKLKEEEIVKSITDDENVISETLADLLVFQGQNSKAMKMYHALILKYPEKSIYFAKKIEALR